jgi:hypothetical protein
MAEAGGTHRPPGMPPLPQPLPIARMRDLDLFCVDRDGLDLRAVQQQIELAAGRLAAPGLRDECALQQIPR